MKRKNIFSANSIVFIKTSLFVEKSYTSKKEYVGTLYYEDKFKNIPNLIFEDIEATPFEYTEQPKYKNREAKKTIKEALERLNQEFVLLQQGTDCLIFPTNPKDEWLYLEIEWDWEEFTLNDIPDSIMEDVLEFHPTYKYDKQTILGLLKED